MFLGHIGVALAAKRVAPRTSLGTLVLAAQFADTLWPFLLLAGVESVRITTATNPFLNFEFLSYPWSHSLLLLCVWGALFAILYFALTRKGRASWILALLVVSHWVLDFISHRPDMPLYPGGAKYGLGLWNSVAATILTETVLFGFGVVVYVRSTSAKDRIGRWGFWALILTLYAVYFASMAPPPPAVQTVAVGAIIGAGVGFVWSWWADRHRVARAGIG
jgi:hypothetical protein